MPAFPSLPRPPIARPALLRLALPLLAAAGLAGCQGRSGLDLGSSWRPTGVVQADLAAQLADPHDLVRGRAADAVPAAIVVPAVTAWMSGKGGTGGGAASGGGATGGAASGGGASGGGASGGSMGGGMGAQ